MFAYGNLVDSKTILYCNGARSIAYGKASNCSTITPINHAHTKENRNTR